MFINVSDLSSFSFCPRSVYLAKVLKLDPAPSPSAERGILGHAIRKELSLRQAKVIGKIQNISDIKKILEEELDSILLDIPHIYKEKLENIDVERCAEEIRPEITNEIKLMEEKLKATIDKLGTGEALRRVTPWRVEFSVRSEGLGLSGRIDKIHMEADKYIPIEIKTGMMPSARSFPWEGDRLQIAAYALLLEDRFDTKVPYGFVEYTRIQEKRPVMTTEKLRREVIYTRDKVIELIKNKTPPEICPHGSGKKCEACGFRDACYEI